MTTTCPICNIPTDPSNYTYIDHAISKQGFSLDICHKCQLGITTPVPTDILSYYESPNYDSHKDAASSLTDLVYSLVRLFAIRNKYKLVTRAVRRPTSILDVGCGTGAFLSYCYDKGLETVGVEPVEKARNIAKHKIPDVFTTVDEIEQTFSIITLWHVLEHLPDPTVTLQQLKHHLSPTGAIFLAVPNYLSADAQHYNTNWAAYDVPRHLWHFTPKTIQMLVAKAGLKVAATYPMIFDSYYVSLLSEQYLKRSPFKSYWNALKYGYQSNKLGRKTGNYSSLIYHLTV